LSELGARGSGQRTFRGQNQLRGTGPVLPERIRADEDRVRAWTFLDPEYALQQARAADQRRREGKPLGALHGIRWASRTSSTLRTCDRKRHGAARGAHAGGRCDRGADAARGGRGHHGIKTVTTELATYAPGKDAESAPIRNILPEVLPAARPPRLAAHMVPLALGTQNQRLDDPAGGLLRRGRFKPGFGLIPRHGY